VRRDDVKLPEWQRKILDRGELYRVGGAVRDELLGVTDVVHDTDFLVRGIPPEELETMLGRLGRIELVGKSFGVYKFVPGGGREVFDIAFPRKERSVGPGHREFQVDWDWDLDVAEDLGRRDFTVNAMARDVRDDRLIDPTGGRRDLEAGILRMIFPEAFEEDPLRILRGVRFAVRFSFAVEEKTKAAMARCAPLLDTLSAERIQDELTKTLSQCDRPSGAFVMTRELGALEPILPELDRCAGVSQNEYHPDDVFVHSIKTCDCAPRDNLLVRWAALLHDVGKVDKKLTIPDEKLGERVVFYGHQLVSAEIAVRVLRRLRYRNVFVKKCENLIRHHMFNYEPGWKPSTVRRFIRRVGEDNLDNLFALRAADALSRDLKESIDELAELKARVGHELEARHTVKIADLAVDGRDVIHECGISSGPAVGKTLAELLEKVLDDPELNNRETLLGLLRERRDGKDG
jgi:putative nucleotidyltransferase with HDIG domain